MMAFSRRLAILPGGLGKDLRYIFNQTFAIVL